MKAKPKKLKPNVRNLEYVSVKKITLSPQTESRSGSAQSTRVMLKKNKPRPASRLSDNTGLLKRTSSAAILPTNRLKPAKKKETSPMPSPLAYVQRIHSLEQIKIKLESEILTQKIYISTLEVRANQLRQENEMKSANLSECLT